jgi:hypothetical protein
MAVSIIENLFLKYIGFDNEQFVKNVVVKEIY